MARAERRRCGIPDHAALPLAGQALQPERERLADEPAHDNQNDGQEVHYSLGVVTEL